MPLSLCESIRRDGGREEDPIRRNIFSGVDGGAHSSVTKQGKLCVQDYRRREGSEIELSKLTDGLRSDALISFTIRVVVCDLRFRSHETNQTAFLSFGAMTSTIKSLAHGAVLNIQCNTHSDLLSSSYSRSSQFRIRKAGGDQPKWVVLALQSTQQAEQLVDEARLCR